jgi:hypothetical protein
MSGFINLGSRNSIYAVNAVLLMIFLCAAIGVAVHIALDGLSVWLWLWWTPLIIVALIYLKMALFYVTFSSNLTGKAILGTLPPQPALTG